MTRLAVTVTPITQKHAHFLHRVLQDAYADAAAAQWRARAATFDQAAPRPGDYLGRATPQNRLDQARRCRAAADACRARADLIEHDPWTTIHDDLDTALRDVARGDAA